MEHDRSKEERLAARQETSIPVQRRPMDNRDDGLVADYRGDMFRSRVSWGAIFAGTVIGVGVMLLLSLLGMSIGLSAINFGGQNGAFNGIPTGAAIWLVLSQLVALGVGGFVAGRFAAIPKVLSSALHGAAVWALASILILYTATSAIGTIVGGATSIVSGVASGVGSVVGAAAPGAVPDQQTRQQIEGEANQILNSVLSPGEQSQVSAEISAAASEIARDPASAREEIRQTIDNLFGNGGVIGPQDRQQAIDVLARRAGMSDQQAQATVDRWQSQISSAAQTAANQSEDLAQSAASGAASAALGAFIASFVGLLAAAGCAVLGRTKEEDVLV